ncbi:gamma-glutamyl-gamma-aminobutyrate hydrolase family protein [Brevibacillus marinus]|uniref:gamma-glutamyl-gamma-aminobutyrate hydrolase family protein n=1 Tax=Brevibacillus marinus TaxID=2496837 RepID=UPI0013DF3E41|nr:gamma-glutamyl-gamma-aminobutyrate hydrolase family protein [Brevibacillus marinus]
MKPLIGITANYSTDEEIGVSSGLGLPGQEWQLLADDYVKALEKAGATPVILPITREAETLSGILPLLDGVLFSGGSDLDPHYYGELPRYGLGSIDPLRDKHEMALARTVLHELDMPVLGICRGCQLINVVQGGTLYQDLQLERPEGFNHTLKGAPKYHGSHPARITEGSRLHSIFGSDQIMVNSFNHQAIKQVGENLEVTMCALDGLVEGIEMKGERFIVAVQWHPEMMLDHYPGYLGLFQRFVDHCREYAQRKK